jgi:hypothetical protein
MGEFRRGTVNVFRRRCGKPNCACAKEGHPGHGPVTTLTYKEKGESRGRVLRSEAEAARAREQVARHDQFQEWSRQWLALNEELSDRRLEALLSGEVVAGAAPEKKPRRRSSRRSRRRSRV